MSDHNKALKKSREIEQKLKQITARLKAKKDLRWFFSDAHYNITKRINARISGRPTDFRDPVHLMYFNAHFATAYINAITLKPSKKWKEAFGKCEQFKQIKKGFTQANYFGPEFLTQSCGLTMVDVHINVDIVKSLKEIGCIDKHDFGNVLLFIQQGSRESMRNVSGNITGTLVSQLSKMIAPLEKTWRNQAYENVCKKKVPPVETWFKNVPSMRMQ